MMFLALGGLNFVSNLFMVRYGIHMIRPIEHFLFKHVFYSNGVVIKKNSGKWYANMQNFSFIFSSLLSFKSF